MNIVDSVINVLASNSRANSGEYKDLIIETIKTHKDYDMFCESITSSLDSLDMKSCNIMISNHESKYYKCIFNIGSDKVDYQVSVAHNNLEALQVEARLVDYVKLAKVPTIFDMMDMMITGFEYDSMKLSRIKSAISSAYKAHRDNVYTDTNNRLKSVCHIFLCSDETKHRVDTQRRSKIRDRVMKHLRDAKNLGGLDDIHYFLEELQVQEIMDS